MYGPPRNPLDYARLIEQSFNMDRDYAAAWPRRVGVRNIRVLRERGRAVAGLGLLHMGQWFGGRRVGCDGLAAVGTLPEDRGTGAGSRLMAHALREMRAPISTLFPSTRPFYAKVGYGHAGVWYRYSIDPARIGVSDRSLPMRRATKRDHARIRAIHEARARIGTGLLDRNAVLWKRMFAKKYVYVVGRDEGYLIYDHTDPPGSHRYDLFAHDVAALTPAAARRILTFFADHATLFRSAQWPGGPVDPLHAHTAAGGWTIERTMPWMIRLVDVRRALEARGYDSAVAAEVHLDVQDDLLPRNRGRWIVEVRGGRARVRRGGRGAVRMDVGELAGLYSGFASRPGFPAIFAGPAPSLIQHF